MTKRKEPCMRIRKHLLAEFNHAYHNKLFFEPHEKSKTTIYLIRNTRTREIKIGITSNLKQRVAKLCNATGIPMELMASANNLPVDAGTVEKFLHEYFVKHRRIGEWFALRDKQIDKIKELYAHLQDRRIERILWISDKMLNYVKNRNPETHKIMQQWKN